MKKEPKPLWIPKDAGTTLKRWYREGPGHYNMRHVMGVPTGTKPGRRVWALFAGDDRVWEVQPDSLLSGAIRAAEDWLTGRS